MSHRKCILLFFVSWNMLLYSAVYGRATNEFGKGSNDNDGSRGPMTLVSDSGLHLPVDGSNGADKNDLKAFPADAGNDRNSENNNNAVGVDENQNISQNQPVDNSILSAIVKQIIPQLLSSLNGNTSTNSNDQIQSQNNPPSRQDLDLSQSQNNSPVESAAINSTQPLQTIGAQNTSSDKNNSDTNPISITIVPVTLPAKNSAVNSPQPLETNGAQSTSSDKNDSDSNPFSVTIIPVKQGDSPQNNFAQSTALVPLPTQQETALESTSASNVPAAQNEPTPIQNETATNQQPSNDQNNSANNSENSTPIVGCGSVDQTADDSQPKLELNQVTVSQILYHLKMQYEDYQLDLKQGDSDDTYELTQKTFLRRILQTSNEKTLVNNKNIVSTTYAAYYSTEYTYTFALCKLHHITKGSKDPQNPIHADISSKCSKIMETFSSFNASYKEIISEVVSNDDNQVLKYDNNDGKTSTSTGTGDSANPSTANEQTNSNSTTKKTSTSNSETLEKQNLEKDLRGYNDNNFYNRIRSEGNVLDQFDVKQNQQIGDSTYSNETKGKKSDSAAYLLSEMREIPKDKPLDDPSNGAMRLRKMSNTLRTDSEADTKGHIQNDEVETNSDRLQQYNRTQKQLDQFERNYFDDDNGDVGGNIKNAKLQDVESHYSATMEHIQDINEQETKPKHQETSTKKYTFKQVVEKLTSYIHVLHLFIGDMEKNTTDNNHTSDNTFDEMHQSIYEQTFSYRKYLNEYFASTNVESGTFGGNKTIDSLQVESENLQTTVEKRFSWLKNVHPQGQSDPKSTTVDEMKSDPIKLLWFFEESSFYLQHFVKRSQVSVPFMSYLPYPNFDVKALPDNQDGVDIQFYLY